MKKKWNRVVVIFFFSLCVVSSAHLIYAKTEQASGMDDSMRSRVKSFLATRGHANITPVNAVVTKIDKGYFLKIDGVDAKTKKDYYIEIVCSERYTDWWLLACLEKGVGKQVSKK